MLRNYFKIAFRKFLSHRSYTLINICGLAIGMTCCIIILLFVRNELDYDKFHRHGERIYRVLRTARADGRLRNTAVTSAPFADGLRNDYPTDIEATTRVMPNDGLVTYEDKAFREEKFYLADANFFEFFSYPLLRGEASQVLKEPNSVVLSQDMAHKYFGEADPIGKILTVDKQYQFKVTGVYGDFPGNSHLDFDFVASIDIYRSREFFSRWWWNSLFTYVRLRPGVTPQSLEAKLPSFMDKYFGDHFRKTGLRMDLTLEPLQDIYFNYSTTFDFVKHGDRNLVTIFSAIALLILLIGCINFMNLTSARSSSRAMEVGLRKVMGAHRQNLMGQFVGEAIMMAVLAMLLALVLTEVLLPYCNQLFQLNLSLNYRNWRLTPFLFVAALLVGLAAGSYPAFVLSAFQPVRALKNKSAKVGGSFFRQTLVVTQFGVSIFLIICTLVMFRQLNYVSSKKLGFEKDRVVLVPVTNREFYRNRESFKNELLRHREIAAVSAMSGAPGGFHDNFSFAIEGIPGDARRMRTVYTDFDYASTLGLKIVAGRDFSREFSTDSTGILLNETAVKSLGWTNEEALGKQMTINLLDSTRRHVIGVVKDYHFTSLKNEIEPLAISIYSDHRVVAIRLKPAAIREALEVIEAAWSKAAPAYPFEYNFLDESFDKLYKAEQKQREIFAIFAVVAIFIACLGLFGLATHSAQQRTKEIGIRKVLGATVTNVTALLSHDFLKLVVVANILAWPVAWYTMTRWLQDFAFRVGIEWWVFLLSSLLALLIAMLTVSGQAIKSALTNPVESLRYE